jgi:hypothetical protein
MKIKRHIVLLGLLVSIFANSQNLKCMNGLNNDSIRYGFAYQSGEYYGKKLKLAKHVVDIKLTKEEVREINKLSYKEWISLPEHEKTDFAFNLVLYYIYEKDAALLVDEKMQDWKQYQKTNDVNYWKNALKKQRKKLNLKDYN